MNVKDASFLEAATIKTLYVDLDHPLFRLKEVRLRQLSQSFRTARSSSLLSKRRKTVVRQNNVIPASLPNRRKSSSSAGAAVEPGEADVPKWRRSPVES